MGFVFVRAMGIHFSKWDSVCRNAWSYVHEPTRRLRHCEMITLEQRLVFEQTVEESSAKLIANCIISQKEIYKL